MARLPSLLVLAAALTGVRGVPAQERPEIASIEPANGATDVDWRKTKAIVVTFDRPMSRAGYSFCGGGPTFPPAPAGKSARWKNATTCILPVALEPDRTYRFSINCPAASNFRSKDGVVLAPVGYSISTAPAKKLTRAEQKRLNAESYDAVQDVLATKYSYYDRMGLDWEAVFEKERRHVVGAKSTRAWAEAVGALLAPTEDLHMVLRYRGDVVPVGRRSVDALYRARRLPAYFATLDKISPQALAGRTDDEIGYLMVGSFSPSLDEGAVARALTRLADTTALIVDCRPNSGGDELVAMRLAQWFVEGTKVYAKNRYRTGKGKNGFGPVLDRAITGYTDDRRYAQPVVVLTSRYVMSSAEAFVLMMRQGRDVTVVGQPTFGSSGNPKPHELPNGVTLVVPSWQAMLPEGTVFEGEGIAPDLEVEATAKQLESSDPILEKALELLRG